MFYILSACAFIIMAHVTIFMVPCSAPGVLVHVPTQLPQPPLKHTSFRLLKYGGQVIAEAVSIEVDAGIVHSSF